MCARAPGSTRPALPRPSVTSWLCIPSARGRCRGGRARARQPRRRWTSSSPGTSPGCRTAARRRTGASRPRCRRGRPPLRARLGVRQLPLRHGIARAPPRARRAVARAAASSPTWPTSRRMSAALAMARDLINTPAADLDARAAGRRGDGHGAASCGAQGRVVTGEALRRGIPRHPRGRPGRANARRASIDFGWGDPARRR